MTVAHVGAASLNQTVGDWRGNQARIREVITAARERGVRLLVLPEMCIPGYSLGDRLFMPDTMVRSWAMLEELRGDTLGMVVCLGLPVRHRGVLYNVVAVVADGRIAGLVPKVYLATGDVQYENRWFQGWNLGQVDRFRSPVGDELPFGTLVFDADGIGTFAVEVCEDGWKGLRPGSIYALAGATVVANPSASWFMVGKHATRRRMCEQISREDHVAYVYASLLGCDATRLVFDGTVLVAEEGATIREGRRFLFHRPYDLVDARIDVEALRTLRMEEGSWRQQVEMLHEGAFGGLPERVEIIGRFASDGPPEAPEPYWLGRPPPARPDPSLGWLVDEKLVPMEIRGEDLSFLELELALALGLHEYRRKSSIPRFTLALSGGRDSSMCALLVARAARYANPGRTDEEIRPIVHQSLTTAYLATAHSGDATRSAARGLAEELGAKHLDVEMQDVVDLHVATVGKLVGSQISWQNPAHDLPLQNVQARLRGSLIWMVANLEGGLLLTTSNKSEAAVGYATMDGDTSGGLSPIADVPKSLVILWVEWAARFYGLASIQQVVATPATAELRPPEQAQTDEGDLMPFAVLDQLMYAIVQRGQDPTTTFKTLWPKMRDRYAGDARAFAAHIKKFVRLLCRAQWKRDRFAISFRVTAFDLDPKTGFRFPAVQDAFTVELEELDRYVESFWRGSRDD
jgi:NAD+ synthase (glutamine-hydrolysing)